MPPNDERDPADMEEEKRRRELAHQAGSWDVSDHGWTFESARKAGHGTPDSLLAQMREANEKLVFATIRAQELADEANNARIEIARSEERFRSLVSASGALVWHATPEGHVLVDRPSWRALTKNVAAIGDDAADWAWLDEVHPECRERVRDAWTAALTAGSSYAHKHRLRRGDGTYAWVESRAVPIPAEGTPREWIGTMTDISDRMLVEEARDRFIGILGHDLRTPLNAIALASEILESSGLPPRPTDLAVRISRSARRINSMISALLVFASGRLGGGVALVRTPCDLTRICADAADEAKYAFPGRAIVCVTTGDLTGSWDPDRLGQLLSNLISNAVQHGLDPIRIEGRGEGDRVVLVVHNDGRPIPEALVPILFEPFRARARSQGLGLGLYIVAELVRAHGGTIDVESTAEAGTTFTVTLPRSELPRDA